MKANQAGAKKAVAEDRHQSHLGVLPRPTPQENHCTRGPTTPPRSPDHPHTLILPFLEATFSQSLEGMGTNGGQDGVWKTHTIQGDISSRVQMDVLARVACFPSP